MQAIQGMPNASPSPMDTGTSYIPTTYDRSSGDNQQYQQSLRGRRRSVREQASGRDPGQTSESYTPNLLPVFSHRFTSSLESMSHSGTSTSELNTQEIQEGRRLAAHFNLSQPRDSVDD